jgi:beta-glucosidase
MRKIIITVFSILIMNTTNAQSKFMWGVASASYQVEGAYLKDGKSLSNWDVYTNKYHITKPFVGVDHNGNIALNTYDRKQYLQDIALMKKLGVNCYRFSLSWSRLLPNGTGLVNQKGVQHYHQFIDDLIANNITPFITLYHWDMPNVLQEKGGFSNPKMIDWFTEYANLVFKEYGKKVKHFITFNEPNIDLFLFTNWAKNVINKSQNPFKISSEDLGSKGMAAHHLMMANAIVTNNYHQLNLGGEIGITLSLIPTEPRDEQNKNDVEASMLQDGIHNRFFLDASLKGSYPADAIALFSKYDKNFKINDEDYNVLKSAKPDFIGVNYYGISYVSYDKNFAMNINWMTNNPDSIKMFNGAVRPKHFYNLLMRLKNEYNNPRIYITENGAGYGDMDEVLENGKVDDNLRTNYLKDHIQAFLDAKKDGARIEGYMLWSILDNFEWTSGYTKRFGITYVDFKTQKRTPKKSFYTYQSLIKSIKF